nr:LysR family transcriptional regulator [Amycolatopsis niigatensis]
MLAIAEEGTFSRAANRLGYTQSSVSQHIAALERTLGGAVFDRPGGPRPVRITPRGRGGARTRPCGAGASRGAGPGGRPLQSR